jgi:hypothetical protein
MTSRAELEEINILKNWPANRLTETQRHRLAFLTFTTNPDLERVRLIRDRAPDLYGLVPTDTRAGLEGYEPQRAAAIAGGREVADPPAAELIAVDAMAAEFRETSLEPAGYADLDTRHRAAFATAVQAGDFGQVIAEWRAWLAKIGERNAFAARRGRVMQGIGRAWGRDVMPEPMFVAELGAAVGGTPIENLLSIPQRG